VGSCRVRTALVILAMLGIGGCASRTSSEEAGIDQEITRNIMWRYREDSAKRFADVRVSCEGREILIEGRVSDSRAASDALQIALSNARGGRVISRLDVRPR
jgi:osmotically-inducible protein OsmY